MIAADPIVRFCLCIWMFKIVYKKMFIGLVTKATYLDVLFFAHLFRGGAHVVQLPWGLVCCRVIFNMLYIPATFQYQCFQPFLTQLLCSPTAANAGAHYNCIVCILCYCFIIYVE